MHILLQVNSLATNCYSLKMFRNFKVKVKVNKNKSATFFKAMKNLLILKSDIFLIFITVY